MCPARQGYRASDKGEVSSLTTAAVTTHGQASGAFRHEALLYSGMDEFVESTGAFIRSGLEADEPVLVVVSGEKIDLLRSYLGPRASGVDFADMADIGANPARIIPAWYDFVAQRATDGRRIRGIGEPIDTKRSPESLVECQRHESLLNLAFADASAWWLLCPYDTTALPQDVIDEAHASHPWVLERDEHRPSERYRDLDQISQPFRQPLSDAPPDATELKFGLQQLDHVRNVIAAESLANGMSDRRTADLILAVNEVATNSVRHGGGKGTLRVWRDGGRLLIDVWDDGVMNKPLAGRHRPIAGQEGGFGVWLVHQVCDLVQMRTFPHGSVVRLHMAIA